MPGNVTWGTARNSGDGKTVYMRMSVNGDPIWFQRSFDSEAVATIIEESLDYEMEQQVMKIKEAAYEQGYKAARNKQHRVNKFNDCLNSTDVGYWED